MQFGQMRKNDVQGTQDKSSKTCSHKCISTNRQQITTKRCYKKRLSGSIVKCVMCGEAFKTMQEFSKHRSFKANYGSDLGCPMRDEYFNGPFKTWKRWSEMYDERSKRLSTIKEREERLKKMLERFRNQKNSSYADLLSVYIKIHPNCTNPLDGFRRGGLSKNIRKRIHAHRNYEAQFMPLDNDYERGEFIIYQLVTDVPEGMARLIEEKLNSSKGFIF